MTEAILPGSFRDPSGSVFRRNGQLYRQVNRVHREHYDHLMSSGLYDTLVRAGALIPHEEVDPALAVAPEVYKVLRPEVVGFVSYPYEWTFGQLRDAALATLEVQRVALDHGMSLRDASAYNVQFHRGRPVLIDTLSFELLQEGKPWVAYRQFCQHFLAPLALMSQRDIRLGQLARVHVDGVPLDLAARLLPWRTRLRPPLLLHVFLHARSQKKYEGAGRTEVERARRRRPFTLQAFRGVIESLEGAVRKLRWRLEPTVWSGYATEADSYSPKALEHKKQVVAGLIAETEPSSVWDFGGNVGVFARLASGRGIPTVCFDRDPVAVEENYRQVVQERETHLLPLLLDLTNPSPALGWENRERLTLAERGPGGLGLALALVHHLAIANNVPLDRLAGFLHGLCESLVIEFVPKSDPKVQILLATREDVFPGYTQDGFERAFARCFSIDRREPIEGSERILYLMRGR